MSATAMSRAESRSPCTDYAASTRWQRISPVGARQDYVHGYSGRERERLADQADTLAELLHSDTFYPSGSVVLEVGCGVGAQTVTLAGQSPEATIVAIDISEESLAAAQESIRSAGFRNMMLRQADVYTTLFAS